MAWKPKIEIEQYHGDGKLDWAVFRSDRPSPMCSGISRDHAEHLKKILSKKEELPEKFPPIKDWYNFLEIVDVDENGYGKSQ